MTFLTVAEAAERAGVSDRHVRRLAATGALEARRIGSTWLIDERALARRVRRAPSTGRTWSASTAWAAVDILSGGDGRAYVDQPRSSRLRARLRELGGPDLQRLAEQRAAVRRFHASPRARERVRGVLFPSGVSALVAGDVARRFGLTPGGDDRRVEGYLVGDLDAVVSTLRLEPSAVGDVVVRRVPGGVDPAPLLGGDAVVALDLMDSDDARERAAGRDALERMLRHV